MSVFIYECLFYASFPQYLEKQLTLNLSQEQKVDSLYILSGPCLKVQSCFNERFTSVVLSLVFFNTLV